MTRFDTERCFIQDGANNSGTPFEFGEGHRNTESELERIESDEKHVGCRKRHMFVPSMPIELDLL